MNQLVASAPPVFVQRDDAATPGCPNGFGGEDDGVIDDLVKDTESNHLLPIKNGKRPYPFFDVKAAAADLKGKRDEDCCNMNLAAAEHYMVARYLAGIGIGVPPLMVLESGIYQLLKKVGGNAFGDPKCPRTPASYKQFKWAMKGSWDGAADLLP